MNLIIVESPTKAKTISRFLGSDFVVKSSYGHVRDLPKSKLGVDVEHNFTPTYIVPEKSKRVIAELARDVQKAERVILATDEDREGEAIAWHLMQTLGLDGMKNGKSKSKPIERIVFHEITEHAIREALQNPRGIDMHLVNAQQARRILDRLVGYELSPFLWRKVRYGLSAGRVQSVAVRLVVEREREIQKFKSQEYWSIEGVFKGKAGEPFPARLASRDGKTLGKFDIKTAQEAAEIVNELARASFAIASVTRKEAMRYPSPPFTTSTLQQDAARKLGLSAKQTMMLAQQLYESGHITYMRTDSVHLAASALAEAAEVIRDKFGKEYALDTPRYFANRSKSAQEAHEAIRPTRLRALPSEITLPDRGQKRLYELIWKRTIACQMQPARIEQTSADIATEDKRYVFRATGQIIKFDGFISVYIEGRDENGDGETERVLPKLEEGEKVKAENISPLQHFTEPPPRYTDATLIKALEAYGIGRPSTYAPTLSVIQTRGYVEKIDKKYRPTEVGIIVNDILVEHFPEIVDYQFTSHIEAELDAIAAGKIKWTEVCNEFYGPFKAHLLEKEASVEKKVEVSDTPCPHCGKPMLIKFGRMGKFLACPDPESKVTLPTPEEAAKREALQEKTRDERCPICGKPMEVRRGRFGYFLGCVDYPTCKGISKIWDKTGFKCPNCLSIPERRDTPGDIVLKKSRGRGRPFWACTKYPDCMFAMNKKPESEAELQEAFKHWKTNLSKKRARL